MNKNMNNMNDNSETTSMWDEIFKEFTGCNTEISYPNNAFRPIYYKTEGKKFIMNMLNDIHKYISQKDKHNK